MQPEEPPRTLLHVTPFAVLTPLHPSTLPHSNAPPPHVPRPRTAPDANRYRPPLSQPEATAVAAGSGAGGAATAASQLATVQVCHGQRLIENARVRPLGASAGVQQSDSQPTETLHLQTGGSPAVQHKLRWQVCKRRAWQH